MKRILMLLVAFFCCSLIRGDVDRISSGSLNSESVTNQSDTKKSWLIRPALGLVCLSFLVLGETMQPSNMRCLQQQCTPDGLLKNFLIQYVSFFGATICHELGHAFVAKKLNNDQIDIHLGGKSEDGDKPLMNFKHLSLHGFSPVVGHAVFTQPYKNKSDMKKLITSLAIIGYCKENNLNIADFDSEFFKKEEFKELLREIAKSDSIKKQLQVDKKILSAILIAGGLCGIAGYCCIRFVLSFLFKIGKSSYSFSSSFFQALGKTFTFDSVILSQLSNMMLPFLSAKSESDAFKLYKECLDVDEDLLKSVSKFSPLIELAAEYFLVKKTTSNNPQIFSKRLLVSCVNYLLRGFLRFSL